MQPSIDGPDNSSEPRLATLLAAAGDPMRLRILALLRGGEHSVAELCTALDAAQPRVSHHLAILRRSGLIEVEVRGRQRIHRWPATPTPRATAELSELLDRWLTGDASEGPAVSTTAPSTRRSDELEDFLL